MFYPILGVQAASNPLIKIKKSLCLECSNVVPQGFLAMEAAGEPLVSYASSCLFWGVTR